MYKIINYFKFRLVYFHLTMLLKYQTLKVSVEVTPKLLLDPLRKKKTLRKVIFIIFNYITYKNINNLNLNFKLLFNHKKIMETKFTF